MKAFVSGEQIMGSLSSVVACEQFHGIQMNSLLVVDYVGTGVILWKSLEQLLSLIGRSGITEIGRWKCCLLLLYVSGLRESNHIANFYC